MKTKRIELAPSFVIAVAVVVGAVALLGYRAYQRQAPHARSERIVREFVRQASAAAGEAEIAFQRATRQAGDRAEVAAAIDQAEAGARGRVMRAAQNARDQLNTLSEHLAWRTLRNRIRRVDRRETETLEYIAERAARYRSQAGLAADREESARGKAAGRIETPAAEP